MRVGEEPTHTRLNGRSRERRYVTQCFGVEEGWGLRMGDEWVVGTSEQELEPIRGMNLGVVKGGVKVSCERSRTTARSCMVCLLY